MAQLRLGILIGSGSRLPAIHHFVKEHEPDATIAVVVSYKRLSPKIEWSKSHGIPALYHRWYEYKGLGKKREEYNDDLAIILEKHGVNLVFGVGWDIIWTSNFLKRFHNRVINAHPFPLPDEPVETITYADRVLPVLRGKEALQRSWEMKLPVTGACVHFARETIDVGPVIVRDYLPIGVDETLESLEKRHVEFEGKVLTKALGYFIEDRVRIVDEKVMLLSKPFSGTTRHKKNVLVIGSGGREHALAWKLSQSPQVATIYVAPGNGGTAMIAENIAISATDIKRLLSFVKNQQVDITLVGPEAALAAGIVDIFKKSNRRIFGPTKAASRLETSKSWAIEFMDRHNIPHPDSQVFHDVEEAVEYAKKLDGYCVVKADGLSLGKGVSVCSSIEEATMVIRQILDGKIFVPSGDPGDTVIIQERLEGAEVSALAFCDGKIAIPIIPAKDHKRLLDDDRGPNTGGVGAIASPGALKPTLLKKIHRLLSLTLEGMREEGFEYKGILYGGFMVVGGEPVVLEYNCRFGDPETQVQLPLLESDLLDILEACIDGQLHQDLVTFQDATAICVVLSAMGYPGSYISGKPIHGLDKIREKKHLHAFHAGTIKNHTRVLTDGGRVLGMTAIAPTLIQARDEVYSVIGNTVFFEDMHYRKDIGANLK